MAPTEQSVPRWALATLVGLGPAAVLAHLPGTWPALAIGSGTLPVAAAMFVFEGERKYYSAAGSAYCVGLGLLGLAGALPDAYAGGPAIALLALGLPSAAIVAAIYAAEELLGRSGSRRSGGPRALLARAVTAVTLYRVARSGLAAGRTALFAGAVVLVGTVTFVLDGLGASLPVPVPGLGRVDAVLLGFVAAVLVAFHGLAAAHTTVLAARDVAASGRAVRRRLARDRSAGEPEATDAEE